MNPPSEFASPAVTPAAFTRPLDDAQIARALIDVDVETVRETGSTSSDLLARARDAQPARPLLRAAVMQTAGRGRHGKRWHTAPGAALLFSIAIPLGDAMSTPAAVTLACGVAIAEVLRADGIDVRLKWPNDVLFEGRKLAGILCEMATDTEARRTLIVGIGVNLWTDAAMRASVAQPVAALDERIDPGALAQGREAWIARLARAVLDRVRDFERGGFMPLQADYMRWFAYADAEVEVIAQASRVAHGRALGVDGEGRLLLQTDEGVRAFGSGELSLRALPAN